MKYLTLLFLLAVQALAQPPAVIDKSSGTAYISTFGTNIQAYPMLGQQSDGTTIPLHLDSDGNLVVAIGPMPIGIVSQGNGNDGSSPWHVIDDAFKTDFDAWKVWADVSLSTRASESTLSSFKSANHTDLAQIDTDLLAFKSANHTDLAQIDTDLLAFKSANHTDVTATTTAVNSFATQNHTDLSSVITNTSNTASNTSAINGKLADDYGSSASALRTASMIGNSSGAADFNSGSSGAQTLRTSANSYGVYNTSLPSLSSGNIAQIQFNKFNELATRNRNKYVHITGNGTVTVKSGAGVLSRICYNTINASPTVTIYDNTAGSGTVIATINPPGTSLEGSCALWEAEFSTGLTIVTAGLLALDITVMYQ